MVKEISKMLVPLETRHALVAFRKEEMNTVVSLFAK